MGTGFWALKCEKHAEEVPVDGARVCRRMEGKMRMHCHLHLLAFQLPYPLSILNALRKRTPHYRSRHRDAKGVSKHVGIDLQRVGGAV